jgi:hypothetical protein
MTPMIREKVARPLFPPAQTLAELHREIDELQAWGMDTDYYDKMVHKVPRFPVVPREPYIVHRCKGHRVLNIGCASGSLHAAIQTTAASVYGIDHEPCGHPGDIWLDLDDYLAVQSWLVPTVDLIVAGEVIEHLCSPGIVLKRLKHAAPGVPLLLTTPNAHAQAGQVWMARGVDCVNDDHVAWYSYQTLGTLLRKCGYTPQGWAYYGAGPVGRNEGLIVVAT